MVYRLSSSKACVIFLDKGPNHYPCIVRWTLNHWTTREAPLTHWEIYQENQIGHYQATLPFFQQVTGWQMPSLDGIGILLGSNFSLPLPLLPSLFLPCFPRPLWSANW